VPVRGGPDGSRLTELGLPTPNIFTGMQEIHGPLEWISLQDMAAATEVCLKLVQLWTAESGQHHAQLPHGLPPTAPIVDLIG
jgi:tripeptide aminopeptidase